MSLIITPNGFPISAVEHDFVEPIDLDQIDTIVHSFSLPLHGIWFMVKENGVDGFKHQWLYGSIQDRDVDFTRLMNLKYPK